MSPDGAPPTDFSASGALGISSARLQQLYAYWSGLAGDALPAFKAIDPLDMKFALGNISVVDVLRRAGGVLDFRFRFVGGEVEDLFDRGLSNLLTRELRNSALREELAETYTRSAETAVPVHSAGTCNYRKGQIIEFERLVLPLAANGRTVDMLLVGAVFEPMPCPDEVLRRADPKDAPMT